MNTSGDHNCNNRFEPIQLLEIELSQEWKNIRVGYSHSGLPYRQVRAFIKLHGQPLGFVDFSMDQPEWQVQDLAYLIWARLGEKINDHLIQDGLPEIEGLEPEGLRITRAPCQADTELLLSDPPFTSVIVCTRDRTEQLSVCLPSLLSLNYPAYEIVIVDNAPGSLKTADLVQKFAVADPRLRYLREDRPGLARARNWGMQHAKGEILAFTDDDVIADPNWLLELVQAFRSNAKAACVTGFTWPAEIETHAQALFEQFGGFNKYLGLRSHAFSREVSPKPDPFYPYLAPKFGSGVNMAFRAAQLRALDGFDPALGAGTPAGGGEDIEIFFRLIMAGHTLVYQPRAIMRHFNRREFFELNKLLLNYGTAFTAYITRCILDDPKRIFFLISCAPQAVKHLFSPKSQRNQNKLSDYPVGLVKAELAGMLRGPLVYLQSLYRVKQI